VDAFQGMARVAQAEFKKSYVWEKKIINGQWEGKIFEGISGKSKMEFTGGTGTAGQFHGHGIEGFMENYRDFMGGITSAVIAQLAG